ncbi:MFS transporter [Streptomyces sp. CA-111067]|uniref:MFS transporter n=1 Tax=Streptomyces sp. CA-111067 TaxID=3240046 RepID=UPI003D96A167
MPLIERIRRHASIAHSSAAAPVRPPLAAVVLRMGVGENRSQKVVVAVVHVAAMFMAIGGRRALLGAIAVFTIASTLCGTATGLDELVVLRVVQGLGGAVMTPVGLAMLFRVYPPDERVRISGVLAVFTALAPALGPVIGGLFTTELSWR